MNLWPPFLDIKHAFSNRQMQNICESLGSDEENVLGLHHTDKYLMRNRTKLNTGRSQMPFQTVRFSYCTCSLLRRAFTTSQTQVLFASKYDKDRFSFTDRLMHKNTSANSPSKLTASRTGVNLLSLWARSLFSICTKWFELSESEIRPSANSCTSSCWAGIFTVAGSGAAKVINCCVTQACFVKKQSASQLHSRKICCVSKENYNGLTNPVFLDVHWQVLGIFRI